MLKVHRQTLSSEFAFPLFVQLEFIYKKIFRLFKKNRSHKLDTT